MTGLSWHDEALNVTFTVGEYAGLDPETGERLWHVSASDGLKPTRTAESAIRQYLAQDRA